LEKLRVWDDNELTNYTYETLEEDKKNLIKELEMLKASSEESNLTQSEIMSQTAHRREIGNCKRRLWVIEGILLHNLDPLLLEQVSTNFFKIEAVPSGYYYPELYALTEPVIQ